jgi:hypothetical protein
MAPRHPLLAAIPCAPLTSSRMDTREIALLRSERCDGSIHLSQRLAALGAHRHFFPPSQSRSRSLPRTATSCPAPFARHSSRWATPTITLAPRASRNSPVINRFIQEYTALLEGTARRTTRMAWVSAIRPASRSATISRDTVSAFYPLLRECPPKPVLAKASLHPLVNRLSRAQPRHH